MIYDLHIDGTPDAPRITRLLADLFDADLHDVRILCSYDDLAANAQASVLGIARPRAGEFALSLEIIARDDGGLSAEEVAMRFARHFQCACLITDDRANPYCWTLITREGDLLQADVDPEALDREELRVVRILHAGSSTPAARRDPQAT